jgi:O-antigen chain-terminating methyltransferase
VYLPFIEPLLSLYTDAKALDLGCGRGEWLELLKESGFDGHGVDLDDGMLAACRQQGLSVATQDAISALIALPDESQLVVSGFHIAEHIQFSDLQLLVQEALRVLKPAGLLILETPNPENITVGTVNFYLDPTHQKPIPPLLLSFLPEYYGFARVKVVRLQEDKSLTGKAWTSLSDVLGGVSPDYAVIAQKHADSPLMDRTSEVFAQKFGLTLDMLVAKFDQQGLHASERAVSAENQAQHASERAVSAETQAQHASERAINAELALTAVHNSSSWRLTAPLRKTGRGAKAFLQRLRNLKLALKVKTKLLLVHASLYVNRRPKLRHAVLSVLARFPNLKTRLKVTILNRSSAQTIAPFVPINLTKLTPCALQIYIDLKAAIEHRQKERN